MIDEFVSAIEAPKACECGWLFPADWKIQMLGRHPKHTHVSFACPKCGKRPRQSLAVLHKIEDFTPEQIEQMKRRGWIRP